MLLATTLAVAAQPTARATVSLNGTWEFRMDPRDEGVAGKWFDAGVAYPDKIQVPGNWQAQGFGEPKGHLRHDYQGRAWYRRSVTVPEEWAGKRIWIHFGGVTARGDLFVNGRKVGAVEHFVTPYEFDITDAVTMGADNVISVQVDSDVGVHNPHKDPVVTPGPVGMFNYWGHWGGLYRPVWLEARSVVHVDTLFVMPNIGRGIARTKVVLQRSAPGKTWEGDVTVVVTPAKGGAESILRMVS
jgi:beta-galactosidase/beta-glucuronidase